MRISDWSSDVCSSDLAGGKFGHSTDVIGIDGVAKALEGLATLHGAWWGNERLDQLTWLPRSMDTPIDTNQIELMRHYINANLTSGAYSSILHDWLVEDHSRLDRVYAKLKIGREHV